MPILLKRNSMHREICWQCGLGFVQDESIVLWDGLRCVVLHAKCALDVGKQILQDAQQAIDLNNIP